MNSTNRRILFGKFLLAGGLLCGAAILPMAMGGATKPDPVHKVDICHRTNSVTNPYTSNNVDEASVDGVDDGPGKQDHNGEHLGPVFDITADPDVAYPKPRNGDQWGDIIPPFYDDGETIGDWEPQNWDAAGQAIFNAGCKIPSEVTTTTTEPDDDDEGTTTTTEGDGSTTTTTEDDGSTTTTVQDGSTTTTVPETNIDTPLTITRRGAAQPVKAEALPYTG